ncbi:DUF859 family phage minor structural protein [Microbacterium arborescens]|uniref:DUF859 family phage minor structural protein n=1 Tax=Microbacterium arborescens TaxID=33883 RepID=UPI000DF7A8A7|nr:DUF859 family phage minor structural protein [Microbacterium arborescens]
MAKAEINSAGYEVEATIAHLETDIAGNRTRWRRRGVHRKTAGFGYWTGSPTAWSASGAGGDRSESATYDFRNAAEQVLIDEEFWLGHNADGSLPQQSFSVSRSMANPPGGTGTATETFQPPTIPRASVSSFSRVGGAAITGADMGATITVHTNRRSDAFTHNIWLAHNTLGSVVIGTGVAGSINWTIPSNLLDDWPNHAEVSFSVWTRTLQNGSRVGVDQRSTFLVRVPPTGVPKITSLTVADDNPEVASIVGKYVQGMSLLRATVVAEGAYGSTVKTAAFSVDGVSAASGGVVPLDVAGTRPVSATVTDSRSRKGTFAGTVDVLPYAPPQVTSWQARRSNASGTPTDDGASIRVDLAAAVASLVNGTQRNALTIRAFTRPVGGTTWTARNVINHSALTYASSFVLSGGAIFLPTMSFDVRIEVSDKFGTVRVMEAVATSRILVDFDGNNGVGFGRYRQRGTVDIEGDAYTSGVFYQGTDARRVLDIADIAKLPVAIDAGSTSTPSTGYATVQFAAGRFTQPPIVTAGGGQQGNVGIARVINVTKDSFQVGIWTLGGAQVAGSGVHWQAVQMAP